MLMGFGKEKQSMKMKNLGRNSSVGCSSRIFYYYGKSGEGVPFNWEMKPGIAKDPPNDELPPLSPPPALTSLGLPKPCFHGNPNNPSTLWSRLRRRLWKRITKGNSKPKRLSLPQCPKNDDDHVKDSNVFETFLECSSDFESFASPRDSNCSSSSSSSSASGRLAMQATTSSGCSSGEAYGRHFGCIPIHFAKNLIHVMKRD